MNGTLSSNKGCGSLLIIAMIEGRRPETGPKIQYSYDVHSSFPLDGDTVFLQRKFSLIEDILINLHIYTRERQ